MVKQIQHHIIKDDWTSTMLEIRNTDCPELSFKIIRNIIDFDDLKEIWNEAVLNSSSTIFQTFEWLNCWWKYFASDQQNALHIILILMKDNLIGIVPSYIQSYEVLGFEIHRQLKLLGSGLNSARSSSYPIEKKGISDYLDIICIKGYESIVASSFISYLKDFPYLFDEIDFQNISEDSFIFKWILPQIKETDFYIRSSRSDICPKLKVPVSMDLYLDMVRSNMRRKVRQALKQIEPGSQCKIEEVKSQSFASAFQNLKLLHQKRWNELGYPGLFSDVRFEKFQDEISKQFMKNGWLWFKTIKQDNKPIAARLGFMFNNKICDYLSGFDVTSSSASIRPGTILLVLMIKEAIENKFNNVDFLRGGEDYKFEISSLVASNYRIFIKNKSSVKVLRQILFQIIKLQSFIKLRLLSEKSIIALHIKQHGPVLFAPAYFQFYFGRLKMLLSRLFIFQRKPDPMPKAINPAYEFSGNQLQKKKYKMKNAIKNEVQEHEF